MLFVAGCGASKTQAVGREAKASVDYPPILEDAEGGAEATSGEEWPEANEVGSSDAVVDVPVEEVVGCPFVFAPAVRGRWFALSGEDYFIDEEGCPAAARTRLPPVVADPRVADCQGQVGRWGDEEDAATNYDGGHLLGHQLGGWGARLNLVPQAASFNRGNWAQIENALAGCDVLPDASVMLTVEVEYTGPTSIVPSAMGMRLEDARTGDRIEVWFPNLERGGVDGTGERARAVAWIKGLGCQPH
ncbi:MAG TPA: DNA/RNA non-specific endonuclease [Polyangiales bacterium]|nr:DNA/RNA non-specific endonuclease [Polyangiales bacterium]